MLAAPSPESDHRLGEPYPRGSLAYSDGDEPKHPFPTLTMARTEGSPRENETELGAAVGRADLKTSKNEAVQLGFDLVGIVAYHGWRRRVTWMRAGRCQLLLFRRRMKTMIGSWPRPRRPDRWSPRGVGVS